MATPVVVAAVVTAALAGNPGALAISRDGAKVFDRAIPDVCDVGCTIDQADVQHVDLDGDGEQEVVVKAYTSGDHCCVEMGIYGWAPATNTYDELTQDWRSDGYEVRDLDPRDGRVQVVARDVRFEDAFTIHQDSFSPAAVFNYDRTRGARLVDATAAWPAPVRANAREALRRLKAYKRGDDARGLVAAYVADQYSLKRGATGLRELERQRTRGTLGTARGFKAYKTTLLRRLKAWGYRG
jgi:hypothetical protein